MVKPPPETRNFSQFSAFFKKNFVSPTPTASLEKLSSSEKRHDFILHLKPPPKEKLRYEKPRPPPNDRIDPPYPPPDWRVSSQKKIRKPNPRPSWCFLKTRLFECFHKNLWKTFSRLFRYGRKHIKFEKSLNPGFPRILVWRVKFKFRFAKISRNFAMLLVNRITLVPNFSENS